MQRTLRICYIVTFCFFRAPNKYSYLLTYLLTCTYICSILIVLHVIKPNMCNFFKILLVLSLFLSHFHRTLRLFVGLNETLRMQSDGCGGCLFTFYRATACDATHGSVKAFLSVRPSVCLSVCQMRGL